MESDKVTLTLTLTDQNAINIVENLPEAIRDETLEKFIIIGDMVVSHASISTRKESVEAFFAPLRADINTIREQLRKIVPTISIPAKKGELTEASIFESYQQHFMDDSFEDVSAIGKYADIIASIENSQSPVLIEVKNYKGDVPSSQVDKFWRDIDIRDAKYGIFISMNTKIAKISSCINLKNNMERTAIFVVNRDLNDQGHLFAFYVVKKLIELEALKKQDVSSEQVEKKLTKIKDILAEMQNTSKALGDIETTAESLKGKCENDLNLISSTARILKRKFNEQIESAVAEIRSVTV